MNARALISREEAAALCGVSVDSFDRRVREHVLTKQIGRRVLVVAESLEAWRERNRDLLPGEAPRHATVVYFIQADVGGPVKIGTTRDVQQRLASLSVAHALDLRVLATFPGGTREERELHARFASDRLRGEWFSSSPALLHYVSGLT
jgi:Meiotically up-regulated gene 113